MTNLFRNLVRTIMWVILSVETGKILLYIAVNVRDITRDDLSYGLIVKVLNLLLMYEIFITLISAVELRRIKLTYVVDTAIIFFIREMVVITFSEKTIETHIAIAFSLVVLSLGLLRVIGVRFSPKDVREHPGL
ncbi:MAG: phosphate-starvation-inducible PsiE family protein [Aquificota bacterium]|nr:phosphate-starvation-inducible PsiE family protein [Aquificota bacterium]